MFQERQKLEMMGGHLGKTPQQVFLPLSCVLLHVLTLALKNVMK